MIEIHLHQFQMKGKLVFCIVCIEWTWMVEAGIEGLSRFNNLGGTMRGLNPLQFLPLGQGAVERFKGVYPWLRLWWVNSLALLGTS